MVNVSLVSLLLTLEDRADRVGLVRWYYGNDRVRSRIHAQA